MFSNDSKPSEEILIRPDCSKRSRMDSTGTKFMPAKNEEKKEKKPSLVDIPEVNKVETDSSGKNLLKSQQNFSQGITLGDYFRTSQYGNEEIIGENHLHLNKFHNVQPINPRITEQSEFSYDNSEKKYLEASFEINESDEDVYNNSDSNSNVSRTVTAQKKMKKVYKNLDNVIEPPNQEQEELKKKIKGKYTNRKISKKLFNQNLEQNEFKPFREHEKKHSLKLSKAKNFPNQESQGNTERISHNDTDDASNSEQRENRMKNSNKQPRKSYNSQSPPHSSALQGNIERRNFSKDAFSKYSQEDKLQNYSSKENIENHIAYRNSYDPNKTQSFLSGNLKEKKEETKFGNFYNNNNCDFNKSSYNNKSRLTLNEFYKNQSKYQDFGNPVGPPPKIKSWNSMNNESDFEKKYCDKDKIKEKMKHEDINLFTKYAGKFKLNEGEYHKGSVN